MAAASAIAPTAMSHIQELRRRILTCVSVLCLGAGASYGVRGQIISFLQRPLGQQLFYTSPTGSFEFVMQICLLTGFLVALPVCCYHLVRFIEPALNRRLGRHYIALLITSSLLLAVAGIAFAYYVSLPAAFRFFGAVGTNGLHPLITIDQYFSFIVGYLATFAVIFQLPLVLLFINKVKPLGPGGLSRWRKWVVLAAFAIALIMPSAPDPLSQVILALPIIVLYEISIWLIWFTNRHGRRMATHPSASPAAQVVAKTSVESTVSTTTIDPRFRPPRRAPVLDLRALGYEQGDMGKPSPRPTTVPDVNILDLRNSSSDNLPAAG